MPGRQINYTSQRLLDWLPRLVGARVLIVGDVMLDEYFIGDAERISPEAPVPVVKISDDRLLLGGAGNVARNMRSLGGAPHLIAVCGADAGADEVRTLCRNGDISAAMVRDPARRTTVKTRIIARQQQMLRFDQEDVKPLSSTVLTEIMTEIEARLTDHTVLILSDYGKGLVCAGLMSELRSLQARCAAQGRGLKILVDPKNPNWHLYQDAYLLTPNTKETGEGAGLPVRDEAEIKAAGAALLKKLGSRHLLATLGAQGMALFASEDVIWHIPTAARKVFDVTGAGDTVIGVLGLALAAGLPLLPACLLANCAAGIVVGEVGAASVSLPQLKTALGSSQGYAATRWEIN